MVVAESETKGKKKFRAKSLATELAYLSIGVAICTVCAWITIPVGVIPVTMQTFAVAAVGALLGAKRGTIAVAVYLLMGLIGIPVFSGFRAGVPALMGATGGYLIGFVFDVFIVGLFSNLPVKNKIFKTAVMYAAMVLGLAFCYFFGTLWFITVFNRGSANPVGIASALSMCVVPYLLPDAAKLLLASVLGVRLRGFIKVRK